MSLEVESVAFNLFLLLLLNLSYADVLTGKDTLHVEVAETFYERARGLMYRTYLAPDSGMLFVFERPQILSFWMLNTLIPLDIVFLDSNFVIVDIKHGIPLDTTPIKSSKPCLYAIETNLNYFKERGIKEGDTLKIIQ